MNIDIFFQFAPSYWYKNCGISLKKDFYSDIDKRLEIKEYMSDYFNQRYPGIPKRHFFLQKGPSINLQPFIIYLGILGAKIKYFDDLDPWAEEPVIDNIMSLEEFINFKIEKSNFFKEIDDIFDYLASNHLPSTIDLFGRGDIANIHSPITTAQKVLGTENFFLKMMDHPSYIYCILDKIAEHYIFLLEYFSGKKGLKIRHVHFGDCVSFALSRELYEQFGIEYKNKIINHFGATSDIHSCGISTHLLESYVKINNLGWAEVAVETDWNKTKEICQKYNLKYISFLLNPRNIRNMNQEEASLLISGILKNNYPMDTVIRTGAIEYGTSDNVIEEMYKSVVSFIDENKNAGFIPPDVKVVW